MILIALGANLDGPFGTPEQTIEAAYTALNEAGIEIVKKSSIWVTAPVPVSDQPFYRNAVVCVNSDLSPRGLLDQLHRIEANFGRVRIKRNEARILDLDLIAYNDLVLQEEAIGIPHPRMHERSFVLVPLCEISQSWKHPILNLSARTLVENLPDQLEISSMRTAA